MNRRQREHDDHTYSNAVDKAGPIPRSLDSSQDRDDQNQTEVEADADYIVCPACGTTLPGIATACPTDGTRFQ